MAIPFPIKPHCSLPEKGHFICILDFSMGLIYVNLLSEVQEKSPAYLHYFRYSNTALCMGPTKCICPWAMNTD